MTSPAKLSKRCEKVIIEVLLLYMVIPGRINFTQLGKYGRHGEQCYRQNFARLRSKSLNWLRFNVSLALRYFGSDGRKAIAIDPSYISKSGKRLRILVVSSRDVQGPLSTEWKLWDWG